MRRVCSASLTLFLALGFSVSVVGQENGTQAEASTDFAPEIPQEADPFIAQIERYKQSVIKVAFRLYGNSGKVVATSDSVGTAFFVSVFGHIVTPTHVLEKKQEIELKFPGTKAQAVIFVSLTKWSRRLPNFSERIIEVDTCNHDKENDISVCSLRKNPFVLTETKEFVKPVRFTEELVPDGTEVAFTGFPEKSEIPLTGRAFVAGYTESGKSGVPRNLLIHGDSWSGNSGSPVYIETGKVIGFIKGRGVGRSQGITLARPSYLIIRLLNRYGVMH